jgi:hypothetical protein
MEPLRTPTWIREGERAYGASAALESRSAELFQDDAWFDEKADYAI